ncbi:MAG: VCBS repeat-containing protein [Nitrososphaerota archaeon]|nr:VCBS repeat-containing protein [Nitrososphaerota archaeon]
MGLGGKPFGRTEWMKKKIDGGAYESSSVFDVDGDGRLDVVCGAYWYENPRWQKHKVCDVRAFGEYYDDLCNIPMDVDGDGYTDFVTGGWWGKELVWRCNPGGAEKEWETHSIDGCGSIETARAWDVDGDGGLEVVPNTPDGALRVYKLTRDGNGRGKGTFSRHLLWDGPSGHGLGFGDIDGDGRGEFVLGNGWLEPPKGPLEGRWAFTPFGFDMGRASVPIVVSDIDGDDAAEMVVGQAHGYGLDYYKKKSGSSGPWVKHSIDPYHSQYHELALADVDGDGAAEILTGNRYRAHCGNDPGETEVVGLYSFKWNGESFTKQVIDHGTVPSASGTGIQMSVSDLDGDGRLDIVAPGKEGLYMFQNLGTEGTGRTKSRGG